MKFKKIHLIVFALIVVGTFLFFIIKKDVPNIPDNIWTPRANNQIKNQPLQLTSDNSVEYLNTSHSFSFKYPKDMKVENFKESEDSPEVILVQNANEGKGFQIVITPFDEDVGNKLSKERIKLDVPDLLVKDEQSILIGQNGEGLAFLSDNADFGGKSREVWFVFNGFLYQISTYAHLDPILQSVFSTWQFK